MTLGSSQSLQVSGCQIGMQGVILQQGIHCSIQLSQNNSSEIVQPQQGYIFCIKLSDVKSLGVEFAPR